MIHEIAFWILFVSALAVLASINAKLDSLHKKLDRVLSCFDGLREYLYEIDPQFDEERAAEEAMADESEMFGGYDHCMLIRQKNAEGKRTLNTPFFYPDGA
jgi:hypothetical protein